MEFSLQKRVNTLFWMQPVGHFRKIREEDYALVDTTTCELHEQAVTKDTKKNLPLARQLCFEDPNSR
jgi:hypothetical protein